MAATSPPEQPAPAPVRVPPDFPVTWESPEAERLFWTIDRVHFPDPLTPLEYDVFTDCFERGFNPGFERYDVPLRVACRRVNTYFYQAMIPLPLPPDEASALASRSEAALEAAMGRLDELWRERWLPEVEEHLAYWEAFDLPNASLPALREHYEGTLRRARRMWVVHFEQTLPVYLALSLFGELYAGIFPGEGALGAYRLLQGLDNKTVQSGRALWRLSRDVLASPTLRAVFARAASSEVVPALARTAEGGAFLVELRAYLDEYGRRGDKWDLVAPRWTEDPTPAIKNLKDYVAQPGRDLEAEAAALGAERERLIAAARERLAGRPPPVAHRFEFLLKAAQVATVLSEDHGHWIDSRGSYALRRVFLELGRRLADAGAIDAPDDVFYLGFEEIRATGAALPGADRRDLVARRRAELAQFRTIRPPPALGTPPAGPPPADPVPRAIAKFFGGPPPAAEPGLLRGGAAAPGRARGTARVARSLGEAAELRPGEVLVAETTAPSWTPLFATAAAVVTDTGGVLSHGAVVAREYGIPAVFGVGSATAAIRDGQLVEVDGDAGLVRLL